MIENSLEAGRGLSPLVSFCLVMRDLCSQGILMHALSMTTQGEDRCSVAQNMFTSQRPHSWELKKTLEPTTKKRLLWEPPSLQKKMTSNKLSNYKETL